MKLDIEKIKKEFGYEGKPKDWQYAFDGLIKHLPEIIKNQDYWISEDILCRKE